MAYNSDYLSSGHPHSHDTILNKYYIFSVNAKNGLKPKKLNKKK